MRPELVLEVVEQVDDLGLHRHVQSRDGLVEHDQPRLERQRPGHPDALSLAARELVRVAVEVLGVEAHAVEQLADPRLDVPARDPVQLQAASR